MNTLPTVVGMDVHKKSITVSVLKPGGGIRSENWTIANEPPQITKLVERLAAQGSPCFCYEAGPCGYPVYRQITGMGWPCAVIAPGLTPVRPGDRVKTDRRDAEKLARLFRAGELTVIHIPTQAEEAVRDLIRAREDALVDKLRARHRLMKFLLRQGRVYRETKTWGVAHRQWLNAQTFELPASQLTLESYRQTLNEMENRLEGLRQRIESLAENEPYKTPVRYLRCLKGVDTLSAMTLIAEIQDFERFKKPTGFMSFTGLVSSEHSSGNRTFRGSITKVGNAHVRRILIESAWHYRRPYTMCQALAERRRGCPMPVIHIAHRAEERLRRKYWHLVQRGKPTQTAVVACARELAGFVWAIAQHFPKRTV
jgi:transposase